MRHKLIKKIIGAFGYKLINKNSVKNERLLGNFNYLNLPKILEYLTKNGLVKSIIQIGANDGSRFDDLNIFIKKYKIKSILVEPIKSEAKKPVFFSLKECIPFFFLDYHSIFNDLKPTKVFFENMYRKGKIKKFTA